VPGASPLTLDDCGGAGIEFDMPSDACLRAVLVLGHHPGSCDHDGLRPEVHVFPKQCDLFAGSQVGEERELEAVVHHVAIALADVLEDRFPDPCRVLEIRGREFQVERRPYLFALPNELDLNAVAG
jgi:hypothetical protein